MRYATVHKLERPFRRPFVMGGDGIEPPPPACKFDSATCDECSLVAFRLFSSQIPLWSADRLAVSSRRRRQFRLQHQAAPSSVGRRGRRGCLSWIRAARGAHLVSTSQVSPPSRETSPRQQKEALSGPVCGCAGTGHSTPPEPHPVADQLTRARTRFALGTVGRSSSSAAVCRRRRRM